MDTLKGLILSGGAGTRLRPITHTSAKQLVPVANKPVLFYGIEALVAAGIEEIVIVIAPETGGEIREAVGDGSAFGARVTYVEQDAPRGLAHAVLTAEEALGGSAFAMYLGDNLLRNGISDLADHFRHDEHDALILLTRVPDPWHYGVAELSGDEVVRLVEKPKDPPSDMALVGVYLFGPAIFDAARSIEPSARGELEITDAIQHLIDRSRRVRSHVITGWWKDTGKVEDLLEANRMVLADLATAIEGTLDSGTVVEGPVRVGAGAVIERSRLRGPLVIGPGASITDSYVGPFSALAEGVVLRHCELENSIVLGRSRLENLPHRIESSLIGRDVVVTASEARPRAHRLMLGDSSRVELA